MTSVEESKHHVSSSILIIGGTGKVGAPTIQALVSAGHSNVRLLVRDVEKAKKTFPADTAARVQFVKGDLDDMASVEKSFEGISRVFLILTRADERKAAAVAKFAKAVNVQAFVYLSVLSPSVSCARENVRYLHARCEDAIAAVGVPYCFLQPTGFFCNYVWLDGAGIKSTGTIYRLSRDVPVTNIDQRDIADAAAKVLGAPDSDVSKYVNRAYSLTGGPDACLTLDDLGKLFTRVVGKDIKVVQLDDVAYYTALQRHLPEPYAWSLLKLFQSVRDASFAHVAGDYEILTGKKPRTLETFITENKASFL